MEQLASLSVCLDTVDDCGKFGGVKRSATDEEAVNVLLAGKVVTIVGIDGAAVLDADFLCNAITNGFGQPVADVRVHLLRLLGSGNAAGADGPHRLVSDDNVAPVRDFI